MFFKILCIYVASVFAVFAAPPMEVVPLEKQQPTIPIVAQSEELEANGTFKFSYETANGIKREETSYDKVLPNARSGKSSTDNGEDKSDESNEIHVQQGSYSYTAPDGTVITVRYIADENGFRPIGDHLPKPPTILIAAFPARILSQKAKTDDNAEGSSAPVAVIAAPNKATKSPEAPKVQSRIAEPLSAEQALSPKSESQDSITTPETPSNTQGPLTEEPISTTETASTTTESASTITESASTTTESVPTTTESASTTTGSSSTTTESATITTEQSSSTKVTSTEQPTTTEVEYSPKVSAKPLDSEEPASTLADSTSYSEATTEAATIVSA